MTEAVASYEVWAWPEFQAFAKRLGIDTTKSVTDLAIHLPFNSREVKPGLVSVAVEYLIDEPEAPENG